MIYKSNINMRQKDNIVDPSIAMDILNLELTVTQNPMKMMVSISFREIKWI
jgi:hypothetical protein